MQAYPWHITTWQQLKSNLEQDHIPGAMLLQATPGLAPQALIERYVSGLMCENDASDPCGFCHACSLLSSESHPDVHIVLPEKDKKNLSVEQIRQANKWALESSQFAGYRVIVIPHAERMNLSASNALLKTLEEPPSACVFILSTDNAQRLLPTIRSRCEVWTLPAPSQKSACEWVGQQLNKDVSRRVAYLCQSEPLVMKAFIEQGHEKAFTTLLDSFIQLATSAQVDVSTLLTTLTKSDVVVDVQLSWLWLVLVSAQKQALGVNDDTTITEAKQLAAHFDYQTLFQQAEALAELKQQLSMSSGLNTDLLVTNWLYSFHSA